MVQIDTETRRLLSELIKEGVFELKPTLDIGGVHYVEIEKNLKGLDLIHVRNLLQNLERQGVVESDFTDRVLTCPDCGSPEVYSKYACPKCDSYNAEYTKLVEHMKCGYISSEDKFIEGSLLVCPGCKARFTEDSKDADYREIGSGYQCEKCGYRFDKPEVVHFCQKCQRTFTYQDAKYIKIFTYKMTEETVNDFRRDLPIAEQIEKILTNKEFKVQLHSRISGASGVQHSFDILAEKNEIRLVIDISITGNRNDMISLLGKKVDVHPTKAVIIDLSNLDELSLLGKVYDIAVFKSASNEHLSACFENLLAVFDSKPRMASGNGSTY